MPRAERSGRRLAGRVIAVTGLVLAALPAYLATPPGWRHVAVRVSCAAVVAVGCVQARRWAREGVLTYPVSALDAPSAAPPAAELDVGFLRLRDELEASIRSRRYFELVLWPRLSALAGDGLPRPPVEPRRPGRRGPSRRAVEGLIAWIEQRP